jgi:hypothetical protein
MLGLALLLGGARRSSRRGIAARRSLRQSRRETTAVSQDRDDLIDQRDAAARAGAGNWLRGLGSRFRPAPEQAPPLPPPAALQQAAPARPEPPEPEVLSATAGDPAPV